MVELSRRRCVASLAILIGVAVSLALAGVSVATAATIEGNNSISAWTPNTATIDAGESVTFKNSSASVSHGVGFDAGAPATPSCTNVPVAAAPSWEGSCTFTQAGTYAFHCTLHTVEMKGTVTVNSSGPGAPIVSTSAASSVTDTGATLKGSVNPNGLATEYFFKYGTTATPYGQETGKTSVPAGSPVTASAGVTGLTAATTYHFKLFAENSSGTTEGSDLTFTTAGPPAATTDPASGVGSIEATLKGTVNPKGLSTEYFFNWGTTTAYGEETAKKSLVAGTSNVAVSQPISGLLPKTTYHFQVVAKNSAGEMKGTDQSFTTSGGPLATTGEATGVTESAALLAGSVNPQGQQTSYYFNYGTSAAYGQKTTEKTAGKGTGNVNVSEQLAGLAPGTTYHFQVVALNAGGTSPGADQVFTTASPPPPPPPPPVITPPPVIPPTTVAAPETKITSKPPAKTKDRTPTIKFSASGGATFQCSVDSKPFKACRSPFTAPALKPGGHRIRVKAVVGGVADPTPAVSNFKVIASK